MVVSSTNAAPVSQLVKSGSTGHLPTLLPDLKPVALLTVDGENERMQVHKYDHSIQEQKREQPRSSSRIHTAKRKMSIEAKLVCNAQQRHQEKLRTESNRLVNKKNTYTYIRLPCCVLILAGYHSQVTGQDSKPSSFPAEEHWVLCVTQTCKQP